MQENEVQHVFLVGAKSLGAYGGYETFINKLTEYHQNNLRLKCHVTCKANGDGCMDVDKTEGAKRTESNTFTYHNADCFLIHVLEKLGSAQAIYFDVDVVEECCCIIKVQKISNPIVYIMACRIGPFIKYFYKKIHKLGGRIYLNPDGWKDIIWLNQKTPHKYRG